MIQRAIIKEKRRNLFVEDEEIGWIWKASKKYPKVQIAIGFAIIRGFRSQEICAINIDDWRGTADMPRIEAVLEKSGIKDTFPILKEFQEILNDYIQKNLHLMKNGYIFSTYLDSKRLYWRNSTLSTLFGRIRSEVGKEHPQVLEKHRIVSYVYRILKIIDTGVINPKEVRAKIGGLEITVRKTIERMYNQGYIDIESKLTPKGKEYILTERYSIRYRITMHSIRRWFETTLIEKGLRREEVAAIMRYLDPRTVDTYWNPYKIWKNEHQVMKDVIGEKFREIEQISQGQIRLNKYIEE